MAQIVEWRETNVDAAWPWRRPARFDNRIGSLNNPIMLPRGQIFYDASCGLCRSSYDRFRPMTQRRGFSWIPLQEPRARTVLNLEGDEMPIEIKLLTRKGRLLGGVEAILYVAKHVWWAWPLWLLGQFPIIRPLMNVWYRWIAKHRHELSSACGIDQTSVTPARVDQAA